MKHFYSWTFLIAGLLLLSSCTGTPAPAQPLFVIAGVTGTTGSSVLVLQDRVLETLPSDAPRFVRFASQDLAAIPRVFDTIEETSTRDELIVLSRAQTANADGTFNAFLDFFNTRGLTPDDPGTFRTSRTRVDLRSLSYSFPATALCPIDLEVTRDGVYALFFNSPTVCNPQSSERDIIVVLTLPTRLPSTTPASVTSSIPSVTLPANPFVRSQVFAGGSSRAGFYVDQISDTLFFLRQIGSQQVELRRLERTAYTSSTPETGTGNVQIISSNLPLRADEFRDMTRVGSNIALLGTGTYVLAPQTVPTDSLTVRATDTVDARSQESRTFVNDVTGTRLLILDDNERLVYHADPTTATNTVAEVEGTVSAFNTTSSFLYVAGSRRTSVFDTLPLNEGDTNLESLLIEETCNTSQTDDGLCGLENPTALTWAEGILLPDEP